MDPEKGVAQPDEIPEESALFHTFLRPICPRKSISPFVLLSLSVPVAGSMRSRILTPDGICYDDHGF
jgi:hypothetical protein